MKDFLHMLFIEPFEDKSFLSICMGAFIWLCMILVISVILGVSIYLIDSVGLKTQEGYGTVTGKVFVKEHTTTTYIYVNEVMVPQIHHYNDEWSIEIEINSQTDRVQVSQIIWNNTRENDRVNCTYKKGRLTNSLYISSLLIAEE